MQERRNSYQFRFRALGSTLFSIIVFVWLIKHFRNGNNMRLKCTATISRMYTMSNEAMAANDVDMKSSGLHVSENLSQGMAQLTGIPFDIMYSINIIYSSLQKTLFWEFNSLFKYKILYTIDFCCEQRSHPQMSKAHAL